MNKINLIEIDTTVFAVVFSIIVLLLQLLLCVKAKNLLCKLIPAVLLTISVIVFSVLSACVGGWDGMGLLFFALLSLGELFICAIGWGIWIFLQIKNLPGNPGRRE